MLLARLAVDSAWQKRGVGRALLVDAVVRTALAADIAGIRALAVHAKDEEARRYYERYDFIASYTDPLHLFALLRDILKNMEG
jgi:GNAT superfamily N-acetyltransferase